MTYLTEMYREYNSEHKEEVRAEKERRANWESDPKFKERKYLITCWVDRIDYDGYMHYFSIEYESDDFERARLVFNEVVEQKIDKDLSNPEMGNINLEFQAEEISLGKEYVHTCVNAYNKVIHRRRLTLDSGNPYDFVYYSFDLIEIPKSEHVDKSLFNAHFVEFEVDKAMKNYKKRKFKK